MGGESYFSADYFTARERFRAAARAGGLRLTTYPLAPNEPWADDLTIDVAQAGTARSVAVVVSSGLHGIEGFAGSAVQLALLEGGGLRPLPEGVALVLVHALNPFGFARLRRANEDNIDLNRNFLGSVERDGSPAAAQAAYQGCHPLYARLDHLLNPRRPPRRLSSFYARALWTVLWHGRSALTQGIVTGQYEYPQGLFFGGKGPSRTQRLLTRHFPEWVGEARQILHFDIHTGLGPWGVLQLLLEARLETEVGQRLARRPGAWTVISLPETAAAAQGTYYSARGDLTFFGRRLFPGRAYDGVCAEFGTYAGLTVLGALRAENQAFHWAAPETPVVRRAQLRLREVFAPAHLTWRDTTVTQGVELIRQAVPV